MRKVFRGILLTGLLLAFLIFSFVYIKTHNIVVLNPKGIIGIKEKELLIIATLLMLLVVVPVFIFTLIFPLHYRAGKGKGKYDPEWGHSSLAEALWWGVPFFIVTLLAIITWTSTHELNPFSPIRNGKKPLVIQAVALEWKWLFIYPEQRIATVNFIQFPENVPLDFEITADAPMNSFWIPQLGGQIYAMPAMRTKLHLIANEKGSYRGCSSNISGKGFAGMVFTAKATTQEEFEAWISSVKNASLSLDAATYEKLAKPSEYNPMQEYILEKADLFDSIIMKYRKPL